MPAYAEEVRAAEKEGVKTLFRAQPVAFKAGKEGLLAEIHLERPSPGETGPHGRRMFAPARAEEIVLPATTAIVAVGQENEEAAWGKALGLGGLAPDQVGRIALGFMLPETWQPVRPR